MPTTVPAGQIEGDTPKELALPDDISKWKKEDYYRARKEHNPKLVPAVAYLGKRFAGSEPAARGLTELLKPVVTEGATGASGASFPSQPAARVQYPYVARDSVKAIVEALGCNGTPVARKTLEEILAGTLTTDHDEVAVTTALETIAAHPCEENDDLLLRVLTAAEILCPADHERFWPAEVLRDRAFGLFREHASGGLRAKLAKLLVKRHAMFPSRDMMVAFLLSSDPLNCESQLVLYCNSDASTNIKATLESQFLGYSSAALARLMGVPLRGCLEASLQRVPMLKPVELTTIDQASQVAHHLWSDEFRTMLEPQLDEQSLAQPSQVLLLSSTIPRDWSRAVLKKILRKHWYEGPRALENAGLPGAVVVDPGLLVAIKMGGPRNDDALRRKSPTIRASRAATSGRSRGTKGVGGKSAKQTMRQQMEADWLRVSRELARVWCERLNTAATNMEGTEAGSGSPAGHPAADLPLDLHLGPNAIVKVRYRLIWPDEATPELAAPQASPTRVYYVCAEETGTANKLTQFYRRQTRSRIFEAQTADNSIWIDSYCKHSQEDWEWSLDIFISPRYNGNGDEVKCVVEILIMAIKRPNEEKVPATKSSVDRQGARQRGTDRTRGALAANRLGNSAK